MYTIKSILTLLLFPLSFFIGNKINEQSPAAYIIIEPTLAGSTSGSFSVSDGGAAIYSIPIVFSPGTSSIEPAISLSYSSSGGNGVMGLGWSMQGISTIQRSGKTLAQDGIIDAASFDGNDSYSLDGERLVLVEGMFGAADSEYRTEQNVQMQIIAKGYTAGYASPEWFRVRTKAGLIMEYGRTNNARIEAQGTNTVMFWCVSKIIDTKGNYMTFTYEENSSIGEYYPLRIDYTGNETTGLTPYNTILFNYTDRIDNTPRYVNGTKMTSSKILTAINCLHDGQLARRYSFEYEEGQYTKLSLLKSIQECGVTFSDCLPPTTFTYENENGLGFTAVNGSSIPDSHLFDSKNTLLQGDWNGDGLRDFMRHNVETGATNFYTNNTNFDFTVTPGPVNQSWIDSGYVQIIDANTDGLSDFYWIDFTSGSNDLYINNGTSDLTFTKRPNPVPPADLLDPGDEPMETFLADYNGDGQVDIMTYRRSSGKNRFFLNETASNNGLPSFALYADDNIIPVSTISASYTDEKLAFFPTDWNNDGLTDFIWLNRNLNGSNSIRLFENKGDGVNLSFASPESPSNINLNGGDGITLGDWNGDGLTDIMWYKLGANADTRWWYNKGDFSFTSETSDFLETFLGIEDNKLFSTDFNGDGASDFVIFNETNGKNRWFLNDGKLDLSRPLDVNNPSEAGFSNPIPSASLIDAGKMIPGAYSGRGGLDLLFLNSENENNNTLWFKTDITPHYLLKEIVNGQGLTTTVEYAPLTEESVYEKKSSATYPQMDFISSMLVVQRMETDDGIGGKSGVSYDYKGGKIDLHGRGFRGFVEIHRTDETTGIKSSNFYERDHRYISAPLMRSETRLPTGQLLNEATFTDTLIAYYGGTAFAAHTIGSETKEYELTGELVSTIKSRMSYDDYGNIITSVVDYGDGHIDSTYNVYNDDYNKWHLGRLIRAESHRKTPSQDVAIRVVGFEYNLNSGLLEQEITEPDLPPELQVIKAYSHDPYGNILTSATTFYNGNNFETRTTNTTYDDKGRFTLSVSNQLGHTKNIIYDPVLGHVLSETDPNGLTVTFAYDPVGRLIRTDMPDGNWTNTEYGDCGLEGSPDLSVFSITNSSSVNPTVCTFFDVLGREVESRTLGFDSTVIIKKSRFNARGLLSEVSTPFFEGDTPVWTIMAYDTIGREVEVIEPGNRRSQTLYLGLITVIINPDNQTTTVRKNVPGRVVQVKDNNDQSIHYSYNSSGNLLSTTDPNGNQITTSYDHYGNKTSTFDPNMGTYTYQYNTIGELKEQAYPNGNTVIFNYDELGRMSQRNEEEGETTWTYDTQSHGLGKIGSINSPDYSFEVSYDTLSRRVIQTEYYEGESFTLQHFYDSKGRPMALHYPEGFAIKYVYNDLSFLSEIRNSITNELYWQADEINARGQLEEQTLGNGVNTIHTFDDNTFRLERIQSNHASNLIQDLSYNFSDIGLLTQRSNAIHTSTENFTYDNLNRLLTSTISGNESLVMTYDDLGNITSKSDVGAYHYGENGAGPHQLTRVELTNADACLPSFTTDFSFTSYNMLKEMKNDSAQLEIAYSANRARMIQRQYLDSTLIQTKYYLGQYYEKIVTDSVTRNLFYIHGMNGVIAVHSRLSTGEEQTEYWHKDHLGSVQSITNEEGALVEVLDYDPWGNRRFNTVFNPANGEAYKFDRGFTGHEHLDLFALINMNGRVYDPVLGRFISPDPFVTAAYNLQNLNRYAYVYNNPLALIDPSGFWSISFRGYSVGSDGFKFSGDPKDWLKSFDINGKDPMNRLIDSIDKRIAKAFGQETWNTVKVVAATIAVAVATGGSGGFIAMVLSGAASGFVGAYSSVSLAGGSANDALKAGLKGSAIGAVTAAATYGVGTMADKAMGGGTGTFQGAQWTSKKLAVYSIKTVSHGVIQGAANEVSGGRFEHGFIAGSFSAAAAPFVPKDLIAGTTISSIVGGTASVLGGGKYSNGAISGAMVFLYNHNAHKAQDKTTERLEAVFETKGKLLELGGDLSPAGYKRALSVLGKVNMGAAISLKAYNADAYGVITGTLDLFYKANPIISVITGIFEPSSIAPSTLSPETLQNTPGYYVYRRP